MTNLMEFIKALSDETRLRILVLLSSRELCVCEICEILDQSQPKISRNLAKLRDIGLVEDKRQGQWVFYYINLKHDVEMDLLKVIANNVNQYPILDKDLERLNEKVKSGRICMRNGLLEKSSDINI